MYLPVQRKTFGIFKRGTVLAFFLLLPNFSNGKNIKSISRIQLPLRRGCLFCFLACPLARGVSGTQ